MDSVHYADGGGTLGAHQVVYARLDKHDDTRRGVIFLPGGGGLEDSWASGTFTQPNSVMNLMRRLMADFPYGKWKRMASMPTNWDWGNQDMVDRQTDLWQQAKDDYGFASTKVHVIGASMGATSLNWVGQNLASVATFTGIIPVVDAQQIDTDNVLVPYSLPEPHTAFGGSPVPNAYCPARHPTMFSDIPGKLFYSNNDSVIDPDGVRAFAGASGFDAINLGDQFPSGFAIPGHAALNLDDYFDEIVDFLEEND